MTVKLSAFIAESIACNANGHEAGRGIFVRGKVPLSEAAQYER